MGLRTFTICIICICRYIRVNDDDDDDDGQNETKIGETVKVHFIIPSH